MPKIIVDYKKCTGCRLCEVSCSFRDHIDFNPRKANIHIKKNEETGLDKPLVCRQCKNAKCAEACPEKAIRRMPDMGVWQIESSLCTGCYLCIEACPFNGIYAGINNIAHKCDLCLDQYPACVDICPSNALRFD